MIKKLYSISGLIAVQSANIPLLYHTLISNVSIPLYTPILLIYGLIAYSWHSIKVTKSLLYLVGNIIGLVINITLLYISIKRG